MEILVYNKNMMRLGVIDDFQTLLWNRKYFECGNFQLYATMIDSNLELIQPGNIITFKGTDEAGVIENIKLDDSANEQGIIVNGRFLLSMLDRRIIKTIFNWNGLTELAMLDLLDTVVQIPLLNKGNAKGFEESTSFQASYKNLMLIESKLSKTSGIGIKVVPDFVNKTMKLETYKGVDHSKSQRVNPRVIFSALYENIDDSRYEYDERLFKNYAIVGGDGEGASRTYITVDRVGSNELREVFVDARDIRPEDFNTRQEYLNALEQRGIENLASNSITESVSYNTSGDSNFKYKTDYDLGDIVTYQKPDWGISMEQRIIEIQEVYENGGLTVYPTLGNLTQTVEWD